MSGHSKWSQIKRAKGAADVKRGQLFTKLGREISVAARDGGGPDPDANARLRLAVQRAREANMPADTIDRAIKRGAGGGDDAALQEILYEGYGPNGAAILIEAMTDNRNRTVAEIRNVFKNGGGSLGEAGCVAWLFDSRGVISIQPDGVDPEDVTLKAIDAGADDFRVDDDGIEIYTEPAQLDAVRSALEAEKVAIAGAELAMIPKTTLELQPRETVTVMKMMERLEELDDVQRVYSNLEFSEEALKEYA
ncbi:MAG: YebC/PmpR family DNA-binding transcriptional regulator [Chloroflexota bacterium]